MDRINDERMKRWGIKNRNLSLGNSRTPHSLTRGRDIYDNCGYTGWRSDDLVEACYLAHEDFTSSGSRVSVFFKAK